MPIVSYIFKSNDRFITTVVNYSVYVAERLLYSLHRQCVISFITDSFLSCKLHSFNNPLYLQEKMY